MQPIACIVAAMGLDLKRDLLQRAAVAALQRLTIVYENRVAMIEANGLDALYKTMKGQSHFYGVIVSGCSTIHNMVKKHDTRSQVNMEKAIIAVWDAQRLHPLILGVQIEACAVIKIFAAKSANHSFLTKKEGLKHIYLCLKVLC